MPLPLASLLPNSSLLARPEFDCALRSLTYNRSVELLPEATAGLEAFAPDLTRVEIEGADHWLHHQKPSEVAAAVLNWCRQRPL